MTQLAELYNEPSAHLVTARAAEAAEAAEEGTCRVVHGNAVFKAALAASCLMLPEKGDTVLLARLEDGRFSVLAVLARGAESGPCRLRLPAGSRLETPGDLALAAGNSLTLHGGQGMAVHTPALSVTAEESRLHVTRLEAVADTIHSWCRSLHAVGVRAQAVYHTLTQCLTVSRRMVEKEDETRAGSSTLIVSGTATVQAANTLTLAEKVSRTDAGQIQLG